MNKIYSYVLSSLLFAGSAALPAAGAAVTPASFVTVGMMEKTAGYQRSIRPVLTKVSSLPESAAFSSRADEAGEHPESIVGMTYVAVYNDQSHDLNCAVAVVADPDGGIILHGFAEGYDVKGTYDPATGKVTIPTGVVVGSDEDYGDITIHSTDGQHYSDEPIVGTVTGNTITFENGLYGTVVYQGEQGGLLVMVDIKAIEANGKLTVTQTSSTTGATTDITAPLVVTKTTDSSLEVVGISNLLYGRYYEVPFAFSEAANTCTLTFGEPVDAARASTGDVIFYLGGINAVGYLDNLEMSVVTSETNTLMTASAAFLGYPNGQQYSGYQFSGIKMEVDFNIYTGETSGGDEEDTDTPTIDGITYLLDPTNNTATVTGCLPTLTDIAIPAQITSAGNTYDVVAIKEAAFQGNSTATSLTIPASIKTIGTDAFRNLRAIKTVYIADLAAWCGVGIANGNANPIYNLFSASSESRWGKLYINGEANPAELVIPEGVTTMSRSFYGYKLLTAVTLPSTLTELGDQAFANCVKLTSAVVPEGVETVGSAFWGCSALETVTLPSTLKTLKSSTFYNCKALASVNLPEGLETIGGMVFSSCGALTTLSLPSTLTTIGMMAFDGCSGLTEIKSAATVPPSAQMYAFDGVDKTIPVYVPAGTIDDYKAAAEWSEFTAYQELSGVEDITADDLNAPVEYFNLSGIRVDNPANGLYIRRQGSKVEKVIL